MCTALNNINKQTYPTIIIACANTDKLQIRFSMKLTLNVAVGFEGAVDGYIAMGTNRSIEVIF